MKLRLWEFPRTAPPPSLTGVVSEEAADDIPGAAPTAAGNSVDHADPGPATVADKDDECCALLRGDAVREDAPRRRQQRSAQQR